MRDILRTLKSEQDELRKLFVDMENPAFKARTDREGLKSHAEALQEHRAVELAVLPDLKKKDTGSLEFAGSAKVLGEFVDHHAKEEETTMFKMARKLFSKEELAVMDEEYDQWKVSPDAAAVLANALKQPRPEPVA